MIYVDVWRIKLDVSIEMGEGYEDYVFKNKERGDKRWTISIAGFVVKN